MAKAFKITQNNQYIQPITLNAGEYTFSAWIKADDETYKFGLRKMDNQLLEFDLSDQLVLQQWAKVRLTFHLTDKVKEFSLMSSGAGNGKTYYVVNPMFEEGSNAGTPKPNELDIEEQVEIGSVTMTLGVTYYVFEFEDNKTGSETIDIPVYVVRNGTYVDIPATDISISSIMPVGMTAVFEQNNIKLTVNDMASKNGQLQINVSVGGIGYIGYFNWRSVSNGKDGEGIAIKGTVNNYAALAQLTGLTAGDSYFNNDDGMLYVWDGTAFPPEGQGILFQGKDGESSIIADLDNEIQSISVDTDGTYMFGLPISTKFSIYAGATFLVLDSLAVQPISGVTATAVKETGIVTVTAVAKTVPDKIDLKIIGKATVNSIQYTREAYLTINKIKRGEEGDSPVLYELQPSVTQIKKRADGTLIPSTISCRMIVTSASGSSYTTTLPYFLSAQRSLDNGETWTSYLLGTSINTASINTAVQFRMYQQLTPITMLDIETIMIVEDGEHGEDGNSPFIGANGNWFVWDSALKKYVDSGDSAHGDDGKSPEIREGYWWAWDGTNWYNTGVKAEGKDGQDGHSPYIGENGNWYVWDSALKKYVDSGDTAQGDDGHSPEIRDSYWWAWDGTKWYNTGVKAEGKDGEDGHSPFVGENGNWYVWDDATGKYVDSGDTSIGDDGKSPEIRDGYWWAWDGTKWYNTGVKAEGKDGEDGHSPFVGENGNWYVWDDATGKYVDSGDTSIGDDGKSPEIRDGYWWAWDGTKWFNTGVKAEGKDGQDGHSPYIGANGNWFIWDSALKKYVDSGDTAQGDDGKSPEIRNGYWWVYENGQWSDTGIKAEGENAKWLKLNSTATQIKVDRYNNSLPASITVFAQLYNMAGTATWTYSVDGGNFTSTLPTGVTRTGNLITVTSANVTFQVLSIKAVMGNAEDTTTITRVEDGQRGLPGKSPVTKEYRVGQTYHNNDIAVHYVYYRAGNSWWKLKDSVESHTASTSSPNTVYFEQLSSVEVMVAETIIAENANLAEFIFKDKQLFSQSGETYAGIPLAIDEYIEYNFANTTTQPAVDSASWTPLPSGTLRWVRYKKNTESSWTVKQIGTSEGQWTMQFSIAPEGATWYSSYSTNRFWARAKEGSGDYGFPFKITTSGGNDFIPNAMIDGVNGIIRGEKVVASNLRNKIYKASSFTPSQIEGLLSEGKSVSFSTSGMFDSDYAWYTINLPNNRDLAGSILTLHMPTGSVKRYRIKPGHADGLFYTNEPLRTLNQIQIVPGVRGTIELKAVWDDLIGSLDWHILSQSRYMANTGSYATESRIPPYFLPNELIFNGVCIVTDSTQPTISKNRQLTNALIQVDKVTSGATKKIKIIVPMQSYHDSLGGTLYRPYGSDRFLRLEADTSSSLYRVAVTSSYAYQNYWAFEVTIFNASNVQIYTSFNFRIFTNDYFIQSPWMGYNLNEV